MKNILLIADDHNHLADLAVELIDAGYQVIPIIDVESALAVLSENVRGDLIILEYQMSGHDALSFMATTLRQLMPRVPIIVLGGRGNLDSYVKFMGLGAFEYMNKPVRGEELRRIVRTALLDSGRELSRKAGIEAGN